MEFREAYQRIRNGIVDVVRDIKHDISNMFARQEAPGLMPQYYAVYDGKIPLAVCTSEEMDGKYGVRRKIKETMPECRIMKVSPRKVGDIKHEIFCREWADL